MKVDWKAVAVVVLAVALLATGIYCRNTRELLPGLAKDTMDLRTSYVAFHSWTIDRVNDLTVRADDADTRILQFRHDAFDRHLGTVKVGTARTDLITILLGDITALEARVKALEAKKGI